MDKLRRRTMGSGNIDEGTYVDLGLPSGTLWATGNLVKDNQGNYSIGAETDQGTYVSWGNIVGHNEGEGYNFDQTAYDSTPGASVSTNILNNDVTHDICLATLGTPWHLPTKEDFQELYDNTYSQWTAINDVAGYKFMKKTDHSVYIFFPASGYYYNNTSLSNRGSIGNYWSSSFYSEISAYYFNVSSYGVNSQLSQRRIFGFTVRPVQKSYYGITITLNPTDGTSASGISVTVTDSEDTEHGGITNAQGKVKLNGVAGGSAAVKVENCILESSTITVSNSSKTFTINCESAYVDLGLPSGLLWARGNITKDSSGNYYMGSETDYGAYFSWGNITPHFSANGSTFDDGYDFGTSNSGPYASTPGKSVSANIPSNDATHDAALALLGSPWHLPTKENFQELYDNTDREWTTINGVNGWKFMKKTDHSLYVFFPAAGYGSGASLSNRGSRGSCWSSSWKSAAYAYYMNFNSSSVNPQSNYNRYLGFSARACQTPHYNITITLNPTDESSVNNVSVTITDSEGTSQTATANANGQVSFSGVANGSATVSAEGYSITTNSTIIVSANATSFTCNCIYLPQGVWAYYSDGTLKSYEDADSSAIGVAVITNNCRFVIDKLATNSDNTIRYGGYNKDLSSIGVVVTSNAATAKLDFDGEGNTTKIITALSGYNDGYVTGAPACEACRAAFGGNGYMGSLGEWNEAYANKASVDSMMTKIGGTAISTSSYHWASTLYNASNYSWILYWNGGTTYNGTRNGDRRVRAFRAL